MHGVIFINNEFILHAEGGWMTVQNEDTVDIRSFRELCAIMFENDVGV